MISNSARCGRCYEIIDGDNYNEIEEDYAVYCHNIDWSIPGGTCWEKRVCEDTPEMEEWLYYGFECDGNCIPISGECSCTNGF